MSSAGGCWKPPSVACSTRSWSWVCRAPTQTRIPNEGLAFDFLSERGRRREVLTGHDNGLITHQHQRGRRREREQLRAGCTRRTARCSAISGTRSGHYYWDRLVRDGAWLDAFRDLFGDERRTTAQALQAHYATARGPTGRPRSSAPMRRRIRGRTGRRPGPTTCTSWTRWRRPAPSAEDQSAASARGRELSTEVDFDPYRSPGHRDGLMTRMAAAHLRGQQPESQHGAAGSVTLRALPARRAETRFRARGGGAGAAGLESLRPRSPSGAEVRRHRGRRAACRSR